MQTISTIGLDIAKSVFQIHGVDANGVVVIRRQLKRRYVLASGLRRGRKQISQRVDGKRRYLRRIRAKLELSVLMNTSRVCSASNVEQPASLSLAIRAC